MKFHKVANLFPMMSAEEFTALKDDIASNGLIEPIWLYDGQVIDGRNRYNACKELGIDPKYKTWNGKGSLVGFVVSLNLHRRHLSATQKATIGVDMKPMLAEEAKERQKKSGVEYGRGKVHPNLGEPISQPQATKQAAKIVGVSHGYISDAQKISEKRPDLFEKMRTNEVTISEAKREVVREERVAERAKQRETIVSSSKVRLVHGDMIETLKVGVDKFDLVVADPPYNVTNWDWDKIGTPKEFIDNTRKWLKSISKTLSPQYHLFWFCSPRYMADIEMVFRELSMPIKSRMVWHRRNMSMGSDAKDKFIDSWEMIFHIGNKPLNFPDKWGDNRFDVQTFAVPQTNLEDTKLHPTQKPLALIKWLVEFGSMPGNTVLDPFAGSGTTGQACLDLGDRSCVLVEKESEYADVIKSRLQL